ncbi:MAG: outer membrane beta-barrel protein, partial [Pirellulales bacterium]
MKRIMRFGSLAACIMAATTTLAQSGLQQPYLVTPGDSGSTPWSAGYASDQTAESLPTAPKQASFDDAAPAEEPKAADDASSSSCGCGEEASCGCEPSCGCDGGCSCGCNDGCCLFGDCCLGDAWTLKSCYDPCGSCDHTIAGWVAMAYYDDNDRLSVQPGDLLSFEDYPDHLNLTQAWIYFEKIAATDGCSADWGYRFDMMYGVDAQKTQAFGNDSPVWDVTFDNG